MLLLLCEKIIIFSLQSSLCLFSNGHKRPKGDWLFLMVKAMGNQTLSTETVTEQEKKATTCQEQKGAVALLLSPSHMATGKTSSTVNESCFKRHAKED